MKAKDKRRSQGGGVELPPGFATVLPDAATFGNATPDYLRGLRLACNLTQAQAADRLGYTIRHWRNFEMGASPIPYPVQFCMEQMERAVTEIKARNNL